MDSRMKEWERRRPLLRLSSSSRRVHLALSLWFTCIHFNGWKDIGPLFCFLSHSLFWTMQYIFFFLLLLLPLSSLVAWEWWAVFFLWARQKNWDADHERGPMSRLYLLPTLSWHRHSHLFKDGHGNIGYLIGWEKFEGKKRSRNFNPKIFRSNFSTNFSPIYWPNFFQLLGQIIFPLIFRNLSNPQCFWGRLYSHTGAPLYLSRRGGLLLQHEPQQQQQQHFLSYPIIIDSRNHDLRSIIRFDVRPSW